jgi:hypothetical protein
MRKCAGLIHHSGPWCDARGMELERFMGMNGTHETGGVATAAAAGWLIPLRLMFVLAWVFNVALLVALFCNAWKNEQLEKLLCMGFFLAWLVGSSAWIAFGSMRRRPVVRMRSQAGAVSSIRIRAER